MQLFCHMSTAVADDRMLDPMLELLEVGMKRQLLCAARPVISCYNIYIYICAIAYSYLMY